jgi:hypothetical protein
MRTIEFEVPAEVMTDFTEKLTDLELENTIKGTNEDGEIIVMVSYEKRESQVVDELEEYLEELTDGNEHEEEEEEEDDNRK